jgi:hypothetical protein
MCHPGVSRKSSIDFLAHARIIIGSIPDPIIGAIHTFENTLYLHPTCFGIGKNVQCSFIESS